MVVVVNVTNLNLPLPRLGLLLPGGEQLDFAQDLALAGLGDTTALASLPAGAAWATLVPETEELTVNASLTFGGPDDPTTPLVQAALNRGTAEFVVSFVSARKPSLGTDTDIQGFEAIAISPDGQHVYGVDGGHNALVVVNTQGLTQRQLLKEGLHDPAGATVHGLAGATDIALAGDRDVYVVSPAQHSVAIFTRDAVTGDLSFRGTVTTPGQDVFDTLALSPDDAQLYVAGEDGIAIYNRDLAGDLTPSDRTLTTPIAFAGVSGLSELAPSADGRFLYAVSPASNTLLVLDGTSLIEVHRFEGGIYGLTGATDVTVSRDDRFVYVTAENGHTLSVFRRGLDDDVSHFQTLANGVAGVRGMAGPSDVALTPDQSFVLVSGALSDAVAVFQHDAETEKLAFVQVLRNNIGGVNALESPRAIATTPAGAQTPGHALVGSGGDSMSLGGLALLEINTSHPEPIGLLTSFADIEALNIITGAGSDTLSLVQAPSAEVVSTTIRTGANNDLVTLLDLSPKTKIVLGEDDDQVQVRADTAGVELLIYGDEEDDSLVHCHDAIAIERVGPDSTTEVFGGPGRDVIRVSGAHLAASSTTVVHGNEPANAPGEEGDSLIFDPQDPYALLDLPPTEGQVQLQDRGLLTYDTFEGDVLIALAPRIEFTGAQFVAGSYQIAEGDTVTLSVSVTPYGSANALNGPVTWDLNGDGIFEEGMGEALTLTWEQFADLGIGDDGVFQIGASATNMEGFNAQAFTTLEVANTPPEVEITPAPSAYVSVPVELAYVASDPGMDRVSQWRIGWGDGTPVEVLGSGASAATHFFQEPGQYVVRVAAVDEDVPVGAAFGELPQQSVEVDVTVRASDVSAGGPYAMAEGQDLALRASAVGSPVSFSWYVNGASGGALGRNPTLTWSQLESLGVNDSGTFHIRVEVEYASGLTVASAEVTLEVANVAPTAELNNDGPVDEGSAGVLVSFAAQSDLSAADRAAGFRYSYDFDDDGVFEQTDTHQSSFLVPAPYLTDDGAVRVRAVIKDLDDGATELFTDIIVGPVAAQVLLVGAADVVEGEVYSLDLAANDPGDDTITQWIVEWGDGTTEVYGAGPQSVEHRFADDGQKTISVTAVDEDGIYSAAKDVRVSNAAPVLTVLADPLSPIAENLLATLTATITDPGVLDSFVLEIQWGDGKDESFALPAGTTTVTLVHRYADDGSYAIDLSLRDDDGGSGAASTSVAVTNAAPAIGSLGLASRVVSEAGLVIVTGTIVDAGLLDTHTVTIQWGDESDSEAVVDPTARTFRATHMYGDDDPTGTPSDDYTITATVVDNIGDTGSRDATLTMENLPPIVTALQISEADAEGWVTLAGRFVDWGTEDTHSVLIDWGDGHTSEAEVDQDVFSFTATHQYVAGGGTGGLLGSYFITATVSDDDGDQDTASAVIATEGRTAVYRGAIPGGAAVTLQASVGDVVDNGDGTWNWSYDTQNGPDESQAVALTATNGAGLESTVVFNLVVNNVAPVVTAAPDQSCEQGLPTNFVLGSLIDPGDDQPWQVALDWGDGSPVETFLLMSPGPLDARSHIYTSTGVYVTTVTVREEDGSGELGSASFEVTVAVPTPRHSITGCVYADVNNNGRMDPAEIGLPNVPVTLTGSAQRTVLTGPDGHYGCSVSLSRGKRCVSRHRAERNLAPRLGVQLR
ncbi:MAG: PKD domain-containing protein [Pirellulaceae bacterium]|nr:PKD domain-containing protein [Pirellulaceae bacterium]